MILLRILWVVSMLVLPDVAPVSTAWQQYYSGTFNSLPYNTTETIFDSNGKVNVHVEIYINTIGWVDITSYVRTDDGTQPISIQRGEADEQQSMPPTSMTLKLNNVSGWASPRNPTGPYYGKIGRNTPIRVRAGTSLRFIGEIASLPQKWDSTGTDAWVPLEAAGPKRRLSQGAKPIRTPLSRVVEGYSPLHYWPLNDAANVTALYDKGSGQTNMAIGSFTQLAKLPGPPGDTTPVIETMATATQVPSYELYNNPSWAARATINDSSSDWTIEFGFKWDQTISYSMLVPLIIRTDNYTIQCWFYNDLPTGQGWRITEVRDKSFASIMDVTVSGASQYTADNQWHQFRVTFVQDGTESYMYTRLDNEVPVYAHITLTMEPVRIIDVMYNMQSDVSSAGIGSVVMWNDLPKPPVGSYQYEPRTYYAFSGYNGETAPMRISRVCVENGLHCTAYGNQLSTEMGPQPPGTLLTVLNDAAVTNGGVLFDSRLDLGFCFRPREDLYNQSGSAISYTSGVYSGELAPTDDDQLTCNDYTVDRPAGGSGRYIKVSGSLNTNDPMQDPNGVGVYDQQGDRNLLADTQLIDYAAWQVHLGTWDETRIPEITFELARECIKNNPVLLNALLALDITSVFSLTNAPIWIPPDDLKLMISGYSEEITNFGMVITFNTTPAGRWDVGVYDSRTPRPSRYSQGDSSLETAVGAADATFSVQFTNGTRWVRAADVADALPFQCMIGGEVVTVTAVSGTTSPQLFTVTRSINGVVKSHEAGTSIEVYPIARYAL